MLLFFLPITYKNLKQRFKFFVRKFSDREFEDFPDLGLGQAERPAVLPSAQRLPEGNLLYRAEAHTHFFIRITYAEWR